MSLDLDLGLNPYAAMPQKPLAANYEDAAEVVQPCAERQKQEDF